MARARKRQSYKPRTPSETNMAQQRDLERRCEKAMKRDVFVLYAVRARAAGQPGISPRDYYCGCTPDPESWVPACKCRREGAENSPICPNNAVSLTIKHD